jgi:hypothetical protein
MPEGAMSGALLADIQRWESLARLTVVMTSGRGVAAQGVRHPLPAGMICGRNGGFLFIEI